MQAIQCMHGVMQLRSDCMHAAVSAYYGVLQQLLVKAVLAVAH
jgi:hypothetical protein